MRIIYWGTFDLERARNQIIRQGLCLLGHDVELCHFDVWKGFPDKTLVKSLRNRLLVLFRYLICYPVLLFRFLTVRRPDAVLIGYMGLFDILALRLCAYIRRTPVVLDSFISLYNTVVDDRQYVSKNSLAAGLILRFERLAFSFADLVLVDTAAHADYFAERYNLPVERIGVVPVGAQELYFATAPEPETSSGNLRLRVLFYGTFIPLHGIATVVEAMKRSASDFADWTVVGKGQELPLFEKAVSSNPDLSVRYLPWASPEELSALLKEHDVALGIFGSTDKAARVIPNKVYEAIASGTRLITRDSPAMRELTDDDVPGLELIPADDADALVSALKKAHCSREQFSGQELFANLRKKIHPKQIASALEKQL